MSVSDKKRCLWCQNEMVLQTYHDEEWGAPLRDDLRQFEFLMMEVMQCGLNWTMMLKKRDTFYQCFDHFDFNKIAKYNETDIQRILATPNMIRSRRKIEAVINNAKQFLKMIEEFGSFSEYLWNYTGNQTVLYRGHELGKIPTKNHLSDEISKDLKKRGFKYLGSITVYAHLQACGMINDHVKECYRYDEINQKNRTVTWEVCDEA